MAAIIGCTTFPAEPAAASTNDVDEIRQGIAKQAVVALHGDLDLCTRHVAYGACIAERNRDVLVDLSDVAFTDCAGFGALMAARLVLQRRGGALTIRNARDQPDRLLALLAKGHTA